ncbi:hypothetical protein RhiirA1_453893 [Rhizophagus irregularis]|uniref:Uncharacterized protein n=1 Tax=Rhizophagus irregularis TaxID=588596 RepID=A0A2N0S6E3_9GLOM|nr:hypothetical protein RhiirA1_453893 [Rhizophagus irregularis]
MREFRYFIVIIAYLLYLFYLIYNIVKDKPNLKVEQIFLHEIDIPDIAICGTPELRILRCDLITNNGEKTPIDGCNSYITPNAIDHDNYDNYRDNCLVFKANKTIKFAKPNSGISAALTIQLTPPDFDFNSLTNTNKAISQMDKATLSEFKLQLNFIAGMVNYAAVVRFKTSTYRSILPGDTRAIFGLEPNYHVTPKIENSVSYIPFNSNPYNIPVGTAGYFSIAAGSFTQEQTSEERTNTIFGAITAFGDAFGTLAGIIVIFFGNFFFVRKSLNSIQDSKEFIERSRFYPKLDFKFSKINDKDKGVLIDEFSKIRCAIFLYLLKNDLNEINEEPINESEYKLEDRFATKVYHWLMNKAYIDIMFNKYRVQNESLNFSSMDKEDQELLNKEFRKIRHVISTYVLENISEDQMDQKMFAEYKYKRELKFSNKVDKGDEKLLNDEFRKIRKLIDKHLLDEPNIEKIFEAFNSQREDFSNDMGKEDKELLIDEFRQIKHVICSHLLDIPKDEEIKYNNSVEKVKLLKIHINDRKLLVFEFYKIKHVINSILFKELKDRGIYKKYKMNRELKFSNKMNEKDKKRLKDEFRTIRYLIDNFLLNESKIQTNINFLENMDSRDKELLVKEDHNNTRNDTDSYVLDKV